MLTFALMWHPLPLLVSLSLLSLFTYVRILMDPPPPPPPNCKSNNWMTPYIIIKHWQLVKILLRLCEKEASITFLVGRGLNNIFTEKPTGLSNLDYFKFEIWLFFIKKVMCHLQKFCMLTLFHQINRFY